MGLDTSHNCWHGAYSAFGRWREGLAKAAGIPLRLMDGYYKGGATGPVGPRGDRLLDEALEWAGPAPGGPACGSYHGPVLRRWIEDVSEWLPISWESLRSDPLHVLLDHSDCDGWIEAADCGPLADRLEELLPLLPTEFDPGHIGDWGEKTRQFIAGLREAAAAGEDVEFH